jgi:hypothetical protein
MHDEDPWDTGGLPPQGRTMASGIPRENTLGPCRGSLGVMSRTRGIPRDDALGP